jgi:hypothetical protein
MDELMGMILTGPVDLGYYDMEIYMEIWRYYEE